MVPIVNDEADTEIDRIDDRSHLWRRIFATRASSTPIQIVKVYSIFLCLFCQVIFQVFKSIQGKFFVVSLFPTNIPGMHSLFLRLYPQTNFIDAFFQAANAPIDPTVAAAPIKVRNIHDGSNNLMVSLRGRFLYGKHKILDGLTHESNP
jgi:hypothetical protein